jgi:uncharacterized protein YijF (DUF1287 family)
MTVKSVLISLIFTSGLFFACSYSNNDASAQTSFSLQLAKSAVSLTADDVEYDPSYFTISYPNGDVPANKGVCTDVVIRAYRKMNIDLQKLVHEDMKKRFNEYPQKWGLKGPDKNIDHRRVPNLMCFLGRYGKTKGTGNTPSEYAPGDIVCWDLGSGLLHIGVLSDVKSSDGKRYQVVHNIGAGQILEDCLFQYKIIGHYSFEGSNTK